jgi:Stabilization of polarity axis
LQYCLDYRPFFTIHDPEFKEYTARCQDPPPVLLGVTNPFFAKALQHWPHIIRIGEMPGTSKKICYLTNVARYSSICSISGNAGGLKIRIKKLASPKVDCKPGVYTSYRPYLQRDKVLLKIIAKGVQTRRPNEVQSALIRRHFLELTQSFIIPLERYMARLMPLQKTISPYKVRL